VRPDQRIFRILTKVRPPTSAHLLLTRLYSIGSSCDLRVLKAFQSTATGQVRLVSTYYTIIIIPTGRWYGCCIIGIHFILHTLYTTHYTHTIHTQTLTQVSIYTHKRYVIILYAPPHARGIYVL